MFKNVLVGVDGKPGGRDAVALARLLTDPDGSITLAHVRTTGHIPLRAIARALVDHEREASERILEEEREATGTAASVEDVVASNPGHGLHIQAEAQGADLIVVGSNGRGVIGRVMLGDDTRDALNGAPCAIAVAASGLAEEHGRLGRIGIAYDGSAESDGALAAARELAARDGARLSAMEVVAYPAAAYVGMAPGVFIAAMQEELAEARRRVAQVDGVDGEVAEGLPGEELARFGKGLDLLVCGSRGYGPLHRIVLGSTTNYLERHARCSLLVTLRGATRPAPGVCSA